MNGPADGNNGEPALKGNEEVSFLKAAVAFSRLALKFPVAFGRPLEFIGWGELALHTLPSSS